MDAYSGERFDNQDDKSMASSVTRHALIPLEGDYQFLLCGIDTLDLGIYVDWRGEEYKDQRADLMSRFDDAKIGAQANGGYVDVTPSDRHYIVLPTGKRPNYRYHLKFAEYHLFIAVTKEPKYSPNTYVSINSETLWGRGIQGAIDLVSSDIKSFGGAVKRILLSRCDLCADFKLPSGLTEDFLKSHSVTRSRKAAYYTGGGCLETHYVGSKGAPILLRLYDKGKEVVVNNKEWFRKLWGTDNIDNVWRIEFQLRREALKQFDINTVEDLKDKSYGVWNYLTDQWFSLRLPDHEKQDRRAIHPFWKNVQECASRFGPTIDVKRDYSAKALPSRMWYASRFFSLLVSMGAVYGFADVESCSNYLFSITDDFMEKGKKDFTEEILKRSVMMGFNPSIAGGKDEPK